MSATPDQLGELAALTKMSPADWADFLACDADAQALIVEGYRGMDWTVDESVWPKVAAILAAVGLAASVISGMAGAAMAVSALKAI